MPRQSQKQKPNVWTVLVVVGVLLVFLRTGLLFKLTTLFAKPLVNNSLNTMQKEVERQSNQPRIVITTAGERIECKRVLDQGKCWGMICKDGRIMAMKKELVAEVQMPPDAPAQ